MLQEIFSHLNGVKMLVDYLADSLSKTINKIPSSDQFNLDNIQWISSEMPLDW